MFDYKILIYFVADVKFAIAATAVSVSDARADLLLMILALSIGDFDFTLRSIFGRYKPQFFDRRSPPAKDRFMLLIFEQSARAQAYKCDRD